MRTNQIPRQVPDQPWYLKTFPCMLLAGILPFGAVFIELYFIFSVSSSEAHAFAVRDNDANAIRDLLLRSGPCIPLRSVTAHSTEFRNQGRYCGPDHARHCGPDHACYCGADHA